MESEKYIQILDDYRIRADTMNIILQEKYEKKDGKGKNATGTGEYDYRDIGYYGNFHNLAKGLLNHEIVSNITKVTSLEELLIHIDKLEKQISNHLTDKVVLTWGKEKGDY